MIQKNGRSKINPHYNGKILKNYVKNCSLRVCEKGAFEKGDPEKNIDKRSDKVQGN